MSGATRKGRSQRKTGRRTTRRSNLTILEDVEVAYKSWAWRVELSSDVRTCGIPVKVWKGVGNGTRASDRGVFQISILLPFVLARFKVQLVTVSHHFDR